MVLGQDLLLRPVVDKIYLILILFPSFMSKTGSLAIEGLVFKMPIGKLVMFAI